jgi:vitamin B12 transporter
VNWILRYQDRRGGYLKSGATVETGYPAIVTLDARMSYRTKSIETFVDFNNLFNANYIDFGNIPQPGRGVRAGIAVSVGNRQWADLRNYFQFSCCVVFL